MTILLFVFSSKGTTRHRPDAFLRDYAKTNESVESETAGFKVINDEWRFVKFKMVDVLIRHLVQTDVDLPVDSSVETTKFHGKSHPIGWYSSFEWLVRKNFNLSELSVNETVVLRLFYLDARQTLGSFRGKLKLALRLGLLLCLFVCFCVHDRKRAHLVWRLLVVDVR